MTAGTVAPSQILREVGRIERTLFIIDWVLTTDIQRRVQIGLNKGEAHHALKNALGIGRQGEIRDRTAEIQHYRMAVLNLLADIVTIGIRPAWAKPSPSVRTPGYSSRRNS